MWKLYQDAMAVFRSLGKPHMFITFTCNPSWPEITEALLPNQTSQMRPDIADRVFKMKLRDLLKDVCENGVTGRVVAWLYAIAFQNRGCHMRT